MGNSVTITTHRVDVLMWHVSQDIVQVVQSGISMPTEKALEPGHLSSFEVKLCLLSGCHRLTLRNPHCQGKTVTPSLLPRLA